MIIDNPPLCECGCKQEVTWNKQEKKWNRFVHGHALIILWQDPDFREKTIRSMTIAQNEPELKARISQSKIKTNQTTDANLKRSQSGRIAQNKPEFKEKQCKIQKIAQNKPETNKKRSQSLIITNQTTDVNLRRSQTLKQLWQNQEFKQNQLIIMSIGQGKKPNKPESFIKMILDEYYPGEWKYTGDYSFWINGKNPDFVNEEQKLVIEHYGTYWHKDDNPMDREEIFVKAGYNTLIIWEKELKNIDILTMRINQFCQISL